MPNCDICFHHTELQSQLDAHKASQHKGIEDKPKVNMDRLVSGLENALDSLEGKPKVVAGAKTSKGDKMASKEIRPTTILVEFKDSQGNLLGSLVGSRRTFSSGSTGYGCYGKIGAKGSSQGYYQVSANVVEVGTKPTKI